MIRVVYRWKVNEANRAAFRAAWETVTITIRETTEGARGSLFLEACDDPTEVMTIAYWDSLEAWQSFIGKAPIGLMKAMHDLGERVSVTPFRQTGDHTV